MNRTIQKQNKQRIRLRTINIVFIPILLFFLWFVFIYVNPIIAIIGAIIALVFGPSELKAQYKIIKDKRRRN